MLLFYKLKFRGWQMLVRTSRLLLPFQIFPFKEQVFAITLIYSKMHIPSLLWHSNKQCLQSYRRKSEHVRKKKIKWLASLAVVDAWDLCNKAPFIQGLKYAFRLYLQCTKGTDVQRERDSADNLMTTPSVLRRFYFRLALVFPWGVNTVSIFEVYP